jgi:hypothetical protein
MAARLFRTPPVGEYWPHTWVVAGDLIISLTQEGQIPVETWSLFVQDVERQTTKRMLGLGYGAISVNSQQRRQLVMAMRGTERAAGVLGSSIARGIATALGWMGTSIRAFGWNDVVGAFHYLSSPDVDPDDGVELVEELLRRSGAPKIDDLAAR